MEGMRTLEYRPEDDLRHDAELGRKARIAAEVLSEYVTECRERAIRVIETEDFTDEQLRHLAVTLQCLRGFSEKMNNYIQRGEIAEEELRNGD